MTWLSKGDEECPVIFEGKPGESGVIEEKKVFPEGGSNQQGLILLSGHPHTLNLSFSNFVQGNSSFFRSVPRIAGLRASLAPEY